MRRMPEVGIFKPTPSRTEAKSDVTTRTARAIVDTEATLRAAKTEAVARRQTGARSHRGTGCPGQEGAPEALIGTRVRNTEPAASRRPFAPGLKPPKSTGRAKENSG